MVIAINTRMLLKGKLEGIGWFTYHTVSRMAINNPQHTFILLFDRPYNEAFIFANNIIPVVVNPPARHPVLWYIWYELMVPRILKKYKAQVFLSMDGFLSLSTKIPQVVVMHDLVYEHYPKFLPYTISKFLRIFSVKYANKAKHIVAVSTYTKQDIINTYKQAPEKISIVYNAANPVYIPLSFAERQKVKEQYTNGAGYFIYAGSLHPRKNIVNLLKAYAHFKKKTNSTLKLILVGRLAWLTKEIEQVLGLHPNKQDIIRIEYLDADELSRLIGAAYAMVYTSLFEGFGIPIVEANSCAVPVITSNTTSMPEVVGNAGLLVNPTDYLSIAEAMMQLYKDENLRDKLIANCLPQAAKFNWNDSATKLMQVIEKVVVS
jgi:glycosyltransferase involved in cell wall biosynthesis